MGKSAQNKQACLWCDTKLDKAYCNKMKVEDRALICEKCNSQKGKLGEMDVAIRASTRTIEQFKHGKEIHGWLISRFGSWVGDAPSESDLLRVCVPFNGTFVKLREASVDSCTVSRAHPSGSI